jgi:hypothetical protein
VGLNSLKSLNLTNVYPYNNKNNNNNNKKNNKVKSKPLELFELAGKKQQYMGGEGLFVASRHNCTGTGYSSTAAVLFWLFREINGHKVATVLVFKSADN